MPTITTDQVRHRYRTTLAEVGGADAVVILVAQNDLAYNVQQMVAVQCRLAEPHGGACADVYRILNGPDGRRSAQRFLNPADATHLAQAGHDAVAEAIVDLGFEPLVRRGS